jgi:WD40 repeat protein
MPVRRVALSSDTRALATATNDEVRVLRPWDSTLGDAFGTGGDVSVIDVRFVRDYIMFAVADERVFLTLWSLSEGGKVLNQQVDAYDVSPNEDYLVTASSDPEAGRKGVTLWNLTAERPFKPTWRLNPRHRVDDATFSGDGKRVAITSSQDNTTTIWDVSTRQAVARRTHARYTDPNERSNRVSMSHDGRYMARARGSAIEVWTTDPAWDRTVRIAGDLRGRSTAASARHLVVASDESLQVLDLVSGREVRQIVTPCAMWQLAVDRSGKQIASAGRCGVIVWDTASGRETRRIAWDRPGSVMQFSADERSLILADARPYARTGRLREVRVYDLKNAAKGPSIVRAPDANREPVHLEGGEAFSADGALLASASDSTVTIRRTVSAETVARIEHPLRHVDGNPLSVAFTEDSRHLITADDYVARMWDVAGQPREIARVALRDEAEDSLVFTLLTPDGRTIASVNRDDGTVRVITWTPSDIEKMICDRLSTRLTHAEWRTELGRPPVQTPCSSR